MRILVLLVIFSIGSFAREINWDSYRSEMPKYRWAIDSAAAVYGLQPLIIDAIICVENDRWYPAAVGIGGCGLMQVSGGSFNPIKSIFSGAGILRNEINKFKVSNDRVDTVHDYLCGLTAYSAGHAGAWRGGRVNDYARLVFKFWLELVEYHAKRSIKLRKK